ncbi:MAG: DUF2953 domain-containing protein [Ruminococcus sp.]
MLVLYIILSILLCLFLLTLFNVYIYAEYKDELSVWIKIAFFKLQIIPQKPKKKKKKHKKKKVKEKKKEPEKQENVLKNFIKEKGLSGIINILKQIATLATETLKDLFKRVTLVSLRLNIQIAGEDAADTAIKYGYCCSVIFPAVSAILSVVKYKERNIQVVPDFSDDPQTKIDGKLVARIRICSLLWFAVTKIGKILKLLINYKTKRS